MARREGEAMPRLWPALLVCAALAIWIDLGDFHRWQCSDSLMPVLTSLYRWTPFYWGCNRIGMLVPLVARTQTAPPAQPFQRLDGCVYKSQPWNDSDSFHVVLPDQKEVVFRLYFVDTPEEERVYADRIAEQAAYFGISADAAVLTSDGRNAIDPQLPGKLAQFAS